MRQELPNEQNDKQGRENQNEGKRLKLSGKNVVIPIQQNAPVQLPDVLEQAIDSYYDSHPELQSEIESAMSQLRAGQTSFRTTNDELLMLTRADVKTVLEAMEALTMQRATVHQDERTDNLLLNTAYAILKDKQKKKYGPPGEKPDVNQSFEMTATISFKINPTEHFDPDHRVGSGLQTFALECVEAMVNHMSDFPIKYHIEVEHGGSVMQKDLEGS